MVRVTKVTESEVRAQKQQRHAEIQVQDHQAMKYLPELIRMQLTTCTLAILHYPFLWKLVE